MDYPSKLSMILSLKAKFTSNNPASWRRLPLREIKKMYDEHIRKGEDDTTDEDSDYTYHGRAQTYYKDKQGNLKIK